MLQLYIDNDKYGKDYAAFQTQNFPGRQGPPHYIVINDLGQVVEDTQDIVPFGVGLTGKLPEAEKKEVFTRFLNSIEYEGTPIDLETGW